MTQSTEAIMNDDHDMNDDPRFSIANQTAHIRKHLDPLFGSVDVKFTDDERILATPANCAVLLEFDIPSDDDGLYHFEVCIAGFTTGTEITFPYPEEMVI
jgi:hypothetical protein